ncbi:hypothetical protein CDV56_101071 [Neofusicoccum parvum]|nr:hypothetical protein CDV56_101071 [Neofusicoccum parvum]
MATTTTSTPPTSMSDPQSPSDMIKQALAALAIVNKARVENPKFNRHEFQDDDAAAAARESAPPLDYRAGAAINATSLARRQAEAGAADPVTNSSAAVARSYSIPPELAEAARVLAEAAPPKPSGNHSDVARAIRERYALPANDTNAPEPLRRPEGLLGEFGVVGEGGAEKRAAATYWMAEMEKLGGSPFAPDGYKVWRNVKDYGAKGDGVTDDTAAINRAIADGGRCGANCGSSTIYPAVVWFPGGTYLVSSSIIQYYNTQFLGDPHDVPTILAASSFVGLGVITSDVYVADNEEWYLNTNNFLRSIKNFKIDIRPTDPGAYVCAIHWQVAQGTSLENIEFYMLYNSDVPGNTQQGIYMENGSGGFLADLTFVGGNFGAYFGNQQFTTSHLVFVNCNTALQVHWDWAWTMQDYIIESCVNGMIIVGGAGGAGSTGQSVGSLILTDTLIANTPNGIITSLYAENSTSLLLQNVGFFNVETAVKDDFQNKVLVPGGNEQILESWGFGLMNNATGQGVFANGQDIPAMNRTSALLSPTGYDKMKPNLFTRRRPKYYDEPTSRIIDVKALGARGDGKTDDTAVLNSILSGAANTSSIVYFPFGVYIIKDTLKVPVGSRIIGQAWSQIMASGPNFEDELHPRVAVKVGNDGDVGIIEIQDMMFTVSGATAGAVLVEWNVHESSQGSVGLWDSHFRVGGAIGSGLQREQCPKLTGKVNTGCKAASMLLHMTPKSTGYLENVWVWVADHDLDVVSQDQIDVYSARGVLIESQLAWLWGTASEHNVFYQYQLSGAKNILMGMIQTESPYFQPTPNAPQPFRTGLFPNDPTFADCTEDPAMCAVSWAVRIIDSSTVYILGSGLYSWFSDYSQDCLKTEDCQARGFEIEESFDLWVYNLCTKAMVEMVSPLGAVPTYARDNVNGFLSSILAWLQGADKVIGERDFPGFQLYTLNGLAEKKLPDTCKTALTQLVKCDGFVSSFREPKYHGTLNNVTFTDSICDAGCGESLKGWFDNVQSTCAGYNLTNSNALPTLLGGRLWAGYNETCLKDEAGEQYCNDVIDGFTLVETIQDMPRSELCSNCNVERLSMMQRTPYSIYDDYYKSDLEYIHSTCGITGDTSIPPPPIIPDPEPETICVSDLTYTTSGTETCDTIALAHSVSSAALFMANDHLLSSCAPTTPVPADTVLCLPLTCATTYTLQAADTCLSIESNATLGLAYGDVARFNPWVSFACENIQVAAAGAYGRTLCLAPQNGASNYSSPAVPGDSTVPGGVDGYAGHAVDPPANATVAEGTTMSCGKWYGGVVEEDSCASICVSQGITISLFLEVNPALGSAVGECSGKLEVGKTYCVGPTYDWDDPITSS